MSTCSSSTIASWTSSCSVAIYTSFLAIANPHLTASITSVALTSTIASVVLTSTGSGRITTIWGRNHRGRRRWSFSLTPTFWPWEKKQSSEKRAFYRFTHHPTLWSAEMPMHKGFERSVGWSWPYTHPTLTLHSDVMPKKPVDLQKYRGLLPDRWKAL